MIPMERDSVFVLPGPFWARAIRSSFRKESLPICFLAPSDVKSVGGAVWAEILVVHGVEWWVLEGSTNAFVVAVRASASAVALSRRIMVDD